MSNSDDNELDTDPPQDAPETSLDGDAHSGDEEQANYHRSDDVIMREQIELLESQLQEKEDLVFALTERLEQAAEQLDRFRRTGAKQNRGGGGGIPAEIIEEQKSLFDEMRQMITQWEASQPGATLGRIEVQVTELRDLVSGNFLGSGGGGAGGQLASGIGEALSSLQNQASAAASKPAASTTEDESHEPGSWEAQKAALMAGEPIPTPEDSPSKAPVAAKEVPVTAQTDESSDTPTPIDLESADVEQLRAAVEERDQIIAALKERLQQSGGSGEVVKYDLMESVPDEFREKLEALEEEWKDKIRETEVELSLERAKMAREKAELQQQQHKMQKEREKLGVGAHSKSGGDSADADDGGGGRWLRFLKRGNEDDE